MNFDLVIKGGEVVDPGSGLLGRMDVGIRGGVIAAVDRSLPTEGVGSTLDATGLVVTPGLFDLHTHIRTQPMPLSYVYYLKLAMGVTTMVPASDRGVDSALTQA